MALHFLYTARNIQEIHCKNKIAKSKLIHIFIVDFVYLKSLKICFREYLVILFGVCLFRLHLYLLRVSKKDPKIMHKMFIKQQSIMTHAAVKSISTDYYKMLFTHILRADWKIHSLNLLTVS